MTVLAVAIVPAVAALLLGALSGARLPVIAAGPLILLTGVLTVLIAGNPLRVHRQRAVAITALALLLLPPALDTGEVAAVVHDVAGRSRAAEVLNDLNVEARWVKFQLIRDRVFVTISVLSRPFVPDHLHQAVRILSEVADGIDDELAAKLNGRTTFSDHD